MKKQTITVLSQTFIPLFSFFYRLSLFSELINMSTTSFHTTVNVLHNYIYSAISLLISISGNVSYSNTVLK